MTTPTPPKKHVLFIKFILTIYAIVLVMISVSNIGIFTPNWPLELFASYARHLLILSPIIGLLFLFFWRARLLFFVVVAATAFWPLATFNKYENPTHAPCQRENCLSLISVNLRGRPAALNRFIKSVRLSDYNIIGVYEIPEALSEYELRDLFPDFPHIFLVSQTLDGKILGSVMAIISKHELTNTAIIPTKIPGERFLPRAFISAEIEMSPGHKIQVFAGHPRLPLSKESMRQRDNLLGQLNGKINDTQNFIIMGDFNLTPWTPVFRRLPGKRAGDPRHIYTWDAERPWLGIPIDHILVGSNIEVIEARVLAGIGSDHRPIMATIAFKE